MKRKYITRAAYVFAGLYLCLSCSKDFIEVQPKATALEANYYTNEAEVFAGLVSVYDPLGKEAGSTYSNKIGALNSASDDCYAGGGSSTDMSMWQAWNNFTLTPANGPQVDLWARNFTGISRANTMLSKLPDAPVSEANRSRYTAECKFLRAYYYFDLVRLFRNVPLFVKPIEAAEIYSATQAAPEDVYKQIELDLTDAIPALPSIIQTSDNGRVSAGAATALLGKVILFQNDESRMAHVAELFKDVNGPTPGQLNAKYNYNLLSNFGDIFSPENKFNTESIFEIVHTSSAKLGWGDWGKDFEGNVAVQMVGPRGYSGPIYVAGWGFNPITESLVAVIKNDPRYKYTVANIDSIDAVNFAATNKHLYEKGYQNTGYFIQKFAPLQKYKSTAGGNSELNYPNDYIEIRLADTYLMEAEALVRAGDATGRAQDLLDAVRARVGLASVEATLDNIYNERRLELATEGHRFFDLVRTKKAATALAFKGFVEGKHEILPIPLAELTNTKLVQNEAYK
jgi:hypothetical protein